MVVLGTVFFIYISFKLFKDLFKVMVFVVFLVVIWGVLDRVTSGQTIKILQHLAKRLLP
jgi:hypothetical protein